ncbi:HutP protein [Halobacteroides halobius DSM 5150]|uniref:Hut operon positive regulatory protein n=1 Tax=Halobacteroides halobius (strain ATCC 35273 / DSM 5150 / MD-1) TaxID=748449 RepID=L0K9N0_HALHC|nr:HutP family protein [Halobacteroides halobius]AGB42007.1 HutP protein [Halobacteroides halobius DSM 5150]
MDLSDFTAEDFVTINKDRALGKMATMLAMVKDKADDKLVNTFMEEGYNAVITRAGGKGEELKNKVLRNALGAAVKGNVIGDDIQNRRVLTRCVERALTGLNGPMSSISGAGIKIGIVKHGVHLAVAIHGKIGIPGLEVDHEISGLGVHYYGLRREEDK